MDNKVYVDIVLFAFPIATGIVSYFIKRIMNNHDKHGDKIIEIEKNYVKKDELEKKQKELKDDINIDIKEQISNIKDDIKALKCEFNDTNNKTLKAVENLSREVNDIKINYIDKNEFVRQNTALSIKLDKIMDMIVEEKEKNANRR